jgi:hypothetical protein
MIFFMSLSLSTEAALIPLEMDEPQPPVMQALVGLPEQLR